MASEDPKQASVWSYSKAPLEFRALFPAGAEADWLAYVPAAQREAMEPSLLRWQAVYPVKSKVLLDRSVVYWGSPRQGIQLMAERNKSAARRPPRGKERRTEVRVQIKCASRYETISEPKLSGSGHTIDMSKGGIAFTTESFLPANATMTLHVAWPVRLEGDVPLELHAAGRLARTEGMRAVVQLDDVSFSIAETSSIALT